MIDDAATVPVDSIALQAALAAIFIGLDLPPADAGWVAHCLVLADLRGIGTHGVSRLPIYAERLRNGAQRARPRIAITATAPSAVHVDGGDALGFVAARCALDALIPLARRHGIAIAGVSHSAHFGMAASYLLAAIDAGLGALVFTNASPSMPIWGGRAPFLGTSPFAFGVPGAEEAPPIVLDMATSVAARGKIRAAAARGEPIPVGWALDRDGRPTTDAARAYDGILLPLGGPKGSGLSLMMEIMAGVLTGAAFGGEVGDQYQQRTRPQDAGHAFILFRPDLFLSLDQYRERLDQLARRARACPPIDPAQPILLPGEPEAETMQQRLERGIPLRQDLLAMLEREAELAGVSLDLHRLRR